MVCTVTLLCCAPERYLAEAAVAVAATGSRVMASLAMGLTRIVTVHSVDGRPCKRF